MSFVEDALTFVDSAAIQYPELNQVIIEMTMPNLILETTTHRRCSEAWPN